MLPFFPDTNEGVLDLLVIGGLLAYVGLVLAVFWLQRARARRSRRLGRTRRTFSPSATALGNAFQTLQLFAEPEVRYVLHEKDNENETEDDEDNLEHPERLLNRHLRRIRNGEEVAALKITAPPREHPTQSRPN